MESDEANKDLKENLVVQADLDEGTAVKKVAKKKKKKVKKKQVAPKLEDDLQIQADATGERLSQSMMVENEP